jgi:pimeloyl-ACP methyl ester carboxylesterase
LIWGNRDQFASASEQKALLAVIPHARLAVYEGIGHAPHWEDPDRFVDDVVEFVYSV